MMSRRLLTSYPIATSTVTFQPKKSVVQELADSQVAQRLVVGLKVPALANLLLERFPLHKKNKATGTEYRIRRIESLIVADEIFGTHVYRDIIHPQARTIMDIGCNIGFFSLYCAEELGRKDIEGIAIDANPEVTSETRWHLKKNGLTKIDVIDGLAGAPKTEREGTFYVSSSNIGSSVRPTSNPNLPAKGTPHAIQVKTVDLAEEWKKRFGPKRIDILKIDVEGSEEDLIKNSADLLALSDRIAIDIHKWVVSPKVIEALLRENGFELFAEVGDSVHCVVGFFQRMQPTS
jgi:FkbM family methyltransferase